MKKLLLLTSVSAIALASSAYAAAPAASKAPSAAPSVGSSMASNLYGTGFLGVAIAPQIKISAKVAGASISATNKANTGLSLGGGVGYRMDSFRAEGDLGYIHTSQKGDSAEKLNIFTYMVNGFYDISTGSAFTPYVGAGIGGATLRSSFDAAGVSDSSSYTQFAYDGQLGVAYKLNAKMAITAGYTYLGTVPSDPKVLDDANAGSADTDLKTHLGANLLNVGFTYSF